MNNKLKKISILALGSALVFGLGIGTLKTYTGDYKNAIVANALNVGETETVILPSNLVLEGTKKGSYLGFTITADEAKFSSSELAIYQGAKVAITAAPNTTFVSFKLTFSGPAVKYGNSSVSSNQVVSATGTTINLTKGNGKATRISKITFVTKKIDVTPKVKIVEGANLDVYALEGQESNKTITASSQNITNPKYQWSTVSGTSATLSDINVASPKIILSNPLVEGITTFAVTAYAGATPVEGDPSAEISVNVIKATVDKVTIDTNNVKKDFSFGETFTTEGLKATVSYLPASVPTTEVKEGFTVNEINTKVLGEQTVNVSYLTGKASYTINVSNKPASFEDVFDTTLITGGYKNDDLALNAEYHYEQLMKADDTYIQFKKNSGFILNKKPLTKITISVGEYGVNSLAVCEGDEYNTYGDKVELTANSSYVVTKPYFKICTFDAYCKVTEVKISKGSDIVITADEQAKAFVDYIKPIRTCAADWTDRNAIVKLVNEYNWMTVEARKSSLLNEVYNDHNVDTSIMHKLMTIVDQYNKTLVKGETKVAIEIPADAKGQNFYTYAGEENAAFKLEGNTITLLIVAVSVLAAAALITVIAKKKHN